MKHSHDMLVQRALRWLLGTMKCKYAFAEIHTPLPIVPDAIGFRGAHSILVECKVSRPDFRADRKKAIHKAASTCPGQERWYLTPKGLVTPREVPKGWGLAEVRGSRIRKIKAPPASPASSARARADLKLLSAAMHRMILGVPFDTETGRFAPYQSLLSETAK
ncbi:MAG: hypothetical protein AAFV53_27090 [Myxococcota bacterium]